jgi:Protein of unknown function (DUF2889)
MHTRAARSTTVGFDPATRVITGHGRDVAVDEDGAETVIRELTFRAEVDQQSELRRLDTSPDAPIESLIGRRVASGFRAAMSNLTGTPDHRLLRRMMWDLPIVVQVGMQTFLLDHPGARSDPRLGLSGVDQCSGWRAGGEMLTQIANAGGILRMPLTPEVENPAEPLLVPMASRRARTLSVTDADLPEVRATFRDSYADPDGIERKLHEWIIEARLDEAAAQFGEIHAEPGRLPWAECPFAGHSAERLHGLRPDQIEATVAADFTGTTTCTHLNDTLRGLTELPDLISRGE